MVVARRVASLIATIGFCSVLVSCGNGASNSSDLKKTPTPSVTPTPSPTPTSGVTVVMDGGAFFDATQNYEVLLRYPTSEFLVTYDATPEHIGVSP